MMWSFTQMAGLFANTEKIKLLLKGTWGLEKESHRVTPAGDLALTDHPPAFGDKLHNPRITTDFAESQLELITPPLPSVKEVYDYMQAIHDEVENEIGDELLWPLSMPPRLPEEEKIPIAKYNDTAAGRANEIYRNSLALRYGKKMQMISGLHYNFSFHNDMLNYLAGKLGIGMQKHELINELYFAMARNYLRYRWLLIYLFGASPSIDRTYDSVICDELDVIERCCPGCCKPIGTYEQYATSLRVSRFGYSNTLQRKYTVSFNSMDEYIASYRKILTTKSAKYEKHGIYKNGAQIQLNSNVLQKENEFYSSIRMKQSTGNGENQLTALEKRGVKYVEVRIMDLNPYERTGISLQQLYFLQVFMLYCLFEQSPPISKGEWKKINENHHMVSLFGRKPNLILYPYCNGRVKEQWIDEIFEKLNTIAKLLDQADKNKTYQTVIEQEHEKARNPQFLLSAMIQKEMMENKETHMAFGIRRAAKNKKISLVGRS